MIARLLYGYSNCYIRAQSAIRVLFLCFRCLENHSIWSSRKLPSFFSPFHRWFVRFVCCAFFARANVSWMLVKQVKFQFDCIAIRLINQWVWSVFGLFIFILSLILFFCRFFYRPCALAVSIAVCRLVCIVFDRLSFTETTTTLEDFWWFVGPLPLPVSLYSSVRMCLCQALIREFNFSFFFCQLNFKLPSCFSIVLNFWWVLRIGSFARKSFERHRNLHWR